MNPETAAESCDTAKQETVYVVMSENSGGVAGMVCATRTRAEDELRSILAEYVTHDATGSHQRHSPDAVPAHPRRPDPASHLPALRSACLAHA